jgi:hypothetical protein
MAVFEQLCCIARICTAVHGQNPEITKAILPDVEKVGTRGELTCVVINQMDNPVSHSFPSLKSNE